MSKEPRQRLYLNLSETAAKIFAAKTIEHNMTESQFVDRLLRMWNLFEAKQRDNWEIWFRHPADGRVERVHLL